MPALPRRNGDRVDTDLDQRVIGIDPDALRKIPRRIAFAGGARKTAAVRGAVGGWANVLITDGRTAESLLAADA